MRRSADIQRLVQLGQLARAKNNKESFMIRNLKVLLAAAMVLGALGVVGAASAQAEPLFHCSVAPCKLKLKPDEAVNTKTSHHVFIVKNSIGESISFTCAGLNGTATSSEKTFTTATVTGLEYIEPCILQIDSSKVTVKTNECDYTLTSHGKVGVTCPGSNVIEVKTTLGCLMKIGSFSDLEGVTYHNLGTEPNREVTVSVFVKGIPVSSPSTSAECGGFNTSKTPLVGEYTTGNTIAEAQNDSTGAKIDGWWV
jgi:hypothetical protein